MPAYNESKSYVLWQNPGSSDIYDRAVNDTLWMVFNSTGSPVDSERYVPVGTLTTTATASSGSPVIQAAANTWFVIPVMNARWIGLQYVSRVTNKTGAGNYTFTAAPLRMFGYGLMCTDPDPDFAYPSVVGNALIDGFADAVTNRNNNVNLLRHVFNADTQGSSNFALSGEADIYTNGLTYSSNLSLNTYHRNSWDMWITPRQSARVIVGALDNDILTTTQPLPYEMIFLQIQTALTSAAPANQVDTLRIKAQLKIKMMW